MQNQEYWRTRFELLEEALAQNSAKFYKQIERQYKRATRDLEKDLAYWYERFAKNEGITLAEAKKILDKGELAAFKMSVEEYIKKGESLDPKWAAELERASVRVHVSRLEAMKLQMQQHAEELASGMASLFDDYAVSTYKEQYYHVAYEVQKGIGVGWAFNKIDKEQIRRVISKPWAQDGKNFSARIWDNRTKLVNELHTTLTSAIARGENPDKTISALTAKMDTSRFNAGRVVMTESAFINSAATKDALKSLDVEKYEILATLDRRTSQVCRDMDGKVFELKDYEVGSTAPPFHPFCRTTTVPWFEDEEEGFRASRGDDGKYYLVPENMTYHDWEKAFVDGVSEYKDELKPAPVEATGDLTTKLAALREELNATSDAAEREQILQRAGEQVISELDSNGTLKQLKDSAKELEDMQRRCRELWSKVTSSKRDADVIHEYNQLANDYNARMAQAGYINADAIKANIAKIRTLGLGEIKATDIVKKSSSAARPFVVRALDYYPREWLAALSKTGPYNAKKVTRGYFSADRKEIALNTAYGENRAFGTALHELGHGFEHSYAGLTKIEKAFYDRRTKGEELRPLGVGYRNDEVTRKDNFLNPYMGKDYGGRFFELVSMGFEMAYTRPTELLEDEDMARFIFGILALL